MKTRTKTILIYLSGLFTGIVLSVAFVFITLWQTASSQYDKIVIFDKPQQELKEKVFDVFQVLPNGNALANSEPRLPVNRGSVPCKRKNALLRRTKNHCP